METKKSYIIIAVLLVGILAGAWVLFGSSGEDDNINRTVSDIKEDNQRAGELIDDARQQIAGASVDAAGALNRVERSQDIIKQNSSTIAECRELCAKLQDNNRQAKSVLADIESANKKPAAQIAPKSD